MIQHPRRFHENPFSPGKVCRDRHLLPRLHAGAGQTLAVTFKPRSLSACFNVLPPGSKDVAIFVGSTSGNHFKNVLAADGVYTIRVYLMRSAARRHETSDYALTIRMEGKVLEPIPASTDATLPGTPFHASASVTCIPAYESRVQACEAFVIRRGFDGTATEERYEIPDALITGG
jgi:hypothetical protein